MADVVFGPGFAVINRTNGTARWPSPPMSTSPVAKPSEILANGASLFPKIKENIRVMVRFRANKRRNESSAPDSRIPLALMGIYIIIEASSFLVSRRSTWPRAFRMSAAVIVHLLMGYDSP